MAGKGTATTIHGDDYTAPINALPATSANIESTEDKTPGCTILISVTNHPFDKSKRLVWARGSFADGEYGPFPKGFQGTKDAPGPLMQVRPGGGAYGKFAGHYRLGWVFECGQTAQEVLVGWLEQWKARFEATIPQVPKPIRAGSTGPKQNLPLPEPTIPNNN